ncbi:MAG: hypothetical protein ABFD12_13080 [Syntrophorhabdus sp.]
MMFLALLPWFALMAAGLVASVILLFWGHKSGQFADQERARYLPLRDEIIAPPQVGKRYGRREAFVLAGFLVMTGIAFAAALSLALIRQYGG